MYECKLKYRSIQPELGSRNLRGFAQIYIYLFTTLCDKVME